MEQQFEGDDEFNDLYADVEVQAINALHQNDAVTTNDHETASRVDKNENVLARNDGNEDCLLKLLSEDDDEDGDSEDELDEKVENETGRGKRKCVSEERMEDVDYYETMRKHMGPNYAASSSILKDSGAQCESNHRSTIMENVLLVRSRMPKDSPANHPLSIDFETYGSVHISDVKQDNSREMAECDLDVTTKTPGGEKKGTRVELDSSQSNQRQHTPAVSCFSSPSSAVDKEKNHKHSKKYQPNSSSEKPDSVKCDYRQSNKSKSDDGLNPITREIKYHETDRHLVRKELKKNKRCNNSKTHLNENYGFGMMNMHYGMRPENSFTYLQGFLPYPQLGPMYMENSFWNIYPNFGFGAGWYNGQNMNAGGCFLEKERPNIDNENLDGNWHHNERRHANTRGTQINNKVHSMHLRRKTEGDLSPLYEHSEDFMKGKFRRHTESINADRDSAYQRYDRYNPFDRREIKSHVRGKRQCESPLDPYPSQKENEDKDPKFIKNPTESGRFGNSTNTAFGTSEDFRYYQPDDHLERRRHTHQSTNTCRSTTGSFNDHFDDKRKHHEHFEATRLPGCEYNERRRQDDMMFLSGGRSNQFHRYGKDRHAFDRVLDHPNDREENTYKMKRKGYSSNQFDWSPKFMGPHNQSVDPRLVVHKKCNLQSFCRTTEAEAEAEDEVYHSSRRYTFKELNNHHNFKDLNKLNPDMHVPAIEGKQCDRSRDDTLSHNQNSKFLDIEEGQIITLDIAEKSMEACELVKQTNDMEYSKAALNESRVEKIDDERIKEIIAKMEKRRERFSEPITLKQDPEKSFKHLPGMVVETGECKMVRPARKRRWNGS